MTGRFGPRLLHLGPMTIYGRLATSSLAFFRHSSCFGRQGSAKASAYFYLDGSRIPGPARWRSAIILRLEPRGSTGYFSC
jgi:hypothetical protein